MTQKKGKLLIIGLVFVELVLFALFFSFIPKTAFAVIGNPNATVATFLDIGNVYPEILNVSIDGGAASVTLTPNTTKMVWCAAVLRDYNGEGDINLTNATFFAAVSSSYTASDDNNYHYSNASCVINTSFGSFNGYSDDAYTALSNCTFNVHYYAVPESWECHVWVKDQVGWMANSSNSITINQLLAVGLPDLINYSEVNATYISDEQVANVTNLGNVRLNLSLEGYAVTPGDGLAMNCSLGNVQNISIEYEKYNITNANIGAQTHTQANLNYSNLTTTPVIKFFNLTARFNDTENEAIKSSYWRIYVPIGVAGTCNGNIVFGATTAAGS
jgi:hypothetical protein